MLIYRVNSINVNNNCNCAFEGNEVKKKISGKGEVEYSHDIFIKSEKEAQRLAFLDYLAYSEGDISAIAETGAQKVKNCGKKVITDFAKRVKK